MGRCVRLATVESKYARTCRKGGELGVFPASSRSRNHASPRSPSRRRPVNQRGRRSPWVSLQRGTRERSRPSRPTPRTWKSTRHPGKVSAKLTATDAAAETAGNFLRRRREGTERSLLSAREDMRVFTPPTGGRCERTRGREDPARTRPHL